LLFIFIYIYIYKTIIIIAVIIARPRPQAASLHLRRKKQETGLYSIHTVCIRRINVYVYVGGVTPMYVTGLPAPGPGHIASAVIITGWWRFPLRLTHITHRTSQTSQIDHPALPALRHARIHTHPAIDRFFHKHLGYRA